MSFSWWRLIIAVKHPYTTSSIAQLLMDNIVALHRLLPHCIVTDRDIIFLRTLQALQSRSTTEYNLSFSGRWANQEVNQYRWANWESQTSVWRCSSVVQFRTPRIHGSIGCHLQSYGTTLLTMHPLDASIQGPIWFWTIQPSTPATVSGLVDSRELHLRSPKHNEAHGR